ncbi:MAG: tetratricopeptide repeat protein [Turneriella sp.]
MRLLGLFAVFAALFIAGTLDARKRYDERGNPLAESTTEPQAGSVQAVPVEGKTPDAAAAPPEKSRADAASATAEPANAAEEETAQQQVRNPLTKVYLENAQLYLRSDRTDKALEFLRRSQEAGEDNYSREARLQSYWLRAKRGDTGLAAEAENLDEALRLAASLRVADGYYTCSRELRQKPECLAEAERVYANLAELAPSSHEGRLAAFRLGQLLLDQGRFEAALPHLTRLLASEPKTPSRKNEVPFDRAWYTLGSLYERPWYHRDTHKARLAYQQVLRYPGSPYHSQAKERIRWLERFGTGYTRTGSP